MKELIIDNPREKGRFIKGYSYSPRTQFKKGIRNNRATEFKKEMIPHNKLTIGTERIRKETNTRSLRTWVKVDEPNIWQKKAIIVWESFYGKLPKGHVVHHIDRDTLNDDIKNLTAMTRREHAEEHRGELVICRREKS